MQCSLASTKPEGYNKMPTDPHDIGSYVPTTDIWEFGQIAELQPGTDDFNQLFVRLYQKLNLIAVNLNLKETGYYLTTEFNNSSLWFNPASTDPSQLRANYTVVVDTGALHNVGVPTTVAHGITVDANTRWTSLTGSATDPATPQGVSLNSAVASIYVDATNVIITPAVDLSSFTESTVVLKYCKN